MSTTPIPGREPAPDSAGLRLMAILAHPDDESLAFGGTLARYAAEGVSTSLLCATRGEVGWQGARHENPGPQALGQLRTAELRQAAAILGLTDVTFLDFIDGQLPVVDAERAIAHIVTALRTRRPQVVVTFGPDGMYGHPDHIAVSQWTTSAISLAGDPAYIDPRALPPHRVTKLYYRMFTTAEQQRFEGTFGAVTIDVGPERRAWLSWPDWAVSARIDATRHWATVGAAVACHRSQVDASRLGGLRPAEQQQIWGWQHYYRAMSATGTDARLEDDLFAGVRLTDGEQASSERAA